MRQIKTIDKSDFTKIDWPAVVGYLWDELPAVERACERFAAKHLDWSFDITSHPREFHNSIKLQFWLSAHVYISREKSFDPYRVWFKPEEVEPVGNMIAKMIARRNLKCWTKTEPNYGHWNYREKRHDVRTPRKDLVKYTLSVKNWAPFWKES